ncbi:hypothetical protein GCM10009799_20800 [Nocardiopsis rhodophaea]|uniref:Integrase n=1 Tax=Nocardiopsis rhodophaea TaxID=280238 RepID=A0ABN2SYE5_9ACTN
MPEKKKKARKNQLPELARSWERALRAGVATRRQKGKPASPYTIRNYLKTIRLLSAYLDEHELPATVKKIRGEDLADWLADTTDTTSPGNAAHHYRNLVAFWAWAVETEKMVAPGKNPMLEVHAPHQDRIKRPPLTQEQVAAMLKACSGRSFLDLRDAAIIRILADTGMRLSGLVGMTYDPDFPSIDNDGRNDVFLDHQPPLVRIRIKGGQSHLVDIGRKTEIALDRYVRKRSTLRHAYLPQLWLGRGGHPFGRQGVQMVLKKRAEQAGIKERIHPHRFRRSMATWHLDADGSRDTLKARAGWSSDDMINLYVSESRDRLAWKESQKLGVADRI